MNDVNWDATRFILDVVQAIGVLAVFVYTWWTNRSRVTKAAIDRVEEKVNQVKADLDGDVRSLDRRVGDMEQLMKHMPDHDDLGEIHEKVNQVAATMNQVSGKLEGIDKTLGLLHEFLLHGGRNK